MHDSVPRPPFDTELSGFLDALQARGPFRFDPAMLPRMRQLDGTEAELDARLAERGLERHARTIPGYLGDPITIAVIQPTARTGTAPAFLAMHGGGMMFGHHLGNLESYDPLLEHDAVLISVDYRLAPEHPDPTPVEDCYAALVWTAAHADELGIDPERIVLVGQSAGGGLAASTALLARDRRGPVVFAQILVSPMLDDRDATVSTQQFDGVGVADRDFVRTGWSAYLGERRGTDAVSPYAAPARAVDLRGLPRTYVDCGSAEVFRDETVAFASRLWASGCDAELHVWPGAFHGFTSMQPDARLARVAVAALADWTARLLQAGPVQA